MNILKKNAHTPYVPNHNGLYLNCMDKKRDIFQHVTLDHKTSHKGLFFKKNWDL